MSDFRNTPVRDLVNSDVRTINPDGLLSAAARAMLENHITCLVVDLQDPARGYGIITQKDIIGLVFDDSVDHESTTVGDVMTHPTLALSPQWNLETAVSLMRMMGVRRAPVVDGDRLLGLLSFTDVFRHVVQGDGAGG